MSSSGGALGWNSPCSSTVGQPKQQQPISSSSFSGKQRHSPIFQQQRVLSRHNGMPFQQLADELLALITSNCKDAAANGAAFETILTILKQLKQQFYLAEESQGKKQNGLQILQNAYEILNHLFFLRSGAVFGHHSLAQHVDRTLKALKQTTSLSHDQYVGPVKALENRKLQVTFCFVESITELLVHDIDTFGLDVDAYEKCGKMRREIANALMNVVYQQREAKFRLCSNLAFLRRVADIVGNVPSLDQYYAGLVQNVSYNSDRKSLLPFAHHLAITVPPMVRVVTFIMGDNDGQHTATNWAEHGQKQRLYKLFSALWNLAENPIENKRVMCLDFPAFVPILLRIMVGDPREVPLIQAAIGIFKHLSTFIIQYPDLFSKTLAYGAVRALLHQIYSSSADLIIDALVALATLCRHPYAAHELLCQKSCLENIQCLTKNTNEGIVRAARTLTDTVNSVYYQVVALQNGMFSSVVGWNCATTSVEANHQFDHQIAGCGADVAVHYNTLPRAAQQNFFKDQKGHNFTKNPPDTPKGVLRQQNFRQYSEQSNDIALAQNPQITTEENYEKLHGKNGVGEMATEEETTDECAFVTEPLIEAGQDLATSVQCTRDGSPLSSRSMDAVNGEEWPSVRSTSFNSQQSSGAGSPASPTDLPDSPSQCVAHKPFQLEAMALLIKKALEEEEEANDGKDDSGTEEEQIWEKEPQIDTDENGGKGGRSAIGQSQKQAKMGSESNGQAKDEDKSKNAASEGTLAEERVKANGSVGNAFLDEVIRNYMPKPHTPTQCIAMEDAHFALNTTPISSYSPSKSPVRTGNDRLLEESIALMMPHPNKKREGKAFAKPKDEQKFGQKMDDHLTADEEEEEALLEQQQKVTAELPADVDAEFAAHWMVVECGTTKSPRTEDEERSRFSLKKTSSQSSIPRPSVAPSDRSPKTATRTADMTDTSATSLLKRPAARSSTLSRTQQKAPPPPLAPKPNIAKLGKPNCPLPVAELAPEGRGGRQ
ncbi:hypothetical protein niasHT_003921 [Heterodera trifolii]|uniref:Uncharacterized protein n=1 Tax=Heterodera trifolii TaxID=157864 RepID=A0ABD2LV56_9BILA